MFERTRADGENESVQSSFEAHGYSLFKLTGPDLYLVPIDKGKTFDAFDLNLFACKPDRAESLAAADLLTATCAADLAWPAGRKGAVAPPELCAGVCDQACRA
jgi:hypothetical protein